MGVNPVPIPLAAFASQVAAQLSGTQLLGLGVGGGTVAPQGVNGAGSSTLAAWRAECVTAQQFGAAGDGVADDSAAFALGFAWLAQAPGRVLFLPPGTYRLASLAAPLAMPDRATLRGAGMHRSRIVWNDTAGANLFTTAGAPARPIADIAFEDLTVSGSCLANWQAASGGYPFLLAYAQGVALRRVCSEGSRAMGMALRFCGDVSIESPLVRYAARDGISVTACRDVTISGAVVEYTDDDAISWHSDAAEAAPHGTLVLTGFRIRFAGGGINALGAKLCVIGNGVLELVRFQGISVGGAAGATEGYAATYGVSIDNVVIRDMLDASLAGDGAGGCRALCLNSAPMQAGALASPPGAGLVPLAGHADGNGPGAAVGIGSGVVVNNLQVLVGRGAVAAYSAYGFGQMFTRHGWIDPAVPAGALQPTALAALGGTLRDVKLANCLFEGGGAPVAVYLAAGARLLATEFMNCTFRDFSDCWLLGNRSPQDIVMRGGLLDLDPYLGAPGRSAAKDGAWQAGATAPVAIRAGGSGLLLDGVSLRNLFDPTPMAASFRRCVLRCDPVGPRGIGLLPAGGEAFSIVREDCNPGSPTYGQVLFTPGLDASQQPQSGCWLAGQFVRNAQPAASAGSVLLGWVRLTTGGGNAPTIDWAAIYAGTH